MDPSRRCCRRCVEGGLREARQVVSTLLTALSETVTSYHPEVTRTGSSLEELVAGTSFFPGGSGLWRGQAPGGALPKVP